MAGSSTLEKPLLGGVSLKANRSVEESAGLHRYDTRFIGDLGSLELKIRRWGPYFRSGVEWKFGRSGVEWSSCGECKSDGLL